MRQFILNLQKDIDSICELNTNNFDFVIKRKEFYRIFIKFQNDIENQFKISLTEEEKNNTEILEEMLDLLSIFCSGKGWDYRYKIAKIYKFKAENKNILNAFFIFLYYSEISLGKYTKKDSKERILEIMLHSDYKDLVHFYAQEIRNIKDYYHRNKLIKLIGEFGNKEHIKQLNFFLDNRESKKEALTAIEKIYENELEN